IISGGLNVYPAEVEAVLARIEGIAEAAVVGIPDDRWGEIPVAVIVDRGAGDSESIITACREQLAAYKVPKRVMVSPGPLTRNTNGKRVRLQIRGGGREHPGAQTGPGGCPGAWPPSASSSRASPACTPIRRSPGSSTCRSARRLRRSGRAGRCGR